MSSITNELPSLKKDYYNILFDTGSSINFIHPDLIAQFKLKTFPEIITFKTANGKSKCLYYTIIKMFKKPIKCHVFNFNTNYNILLGIEAFKLLNIKLDFNTNTVQLEGKSFNLHTKEKSVTEVNNIQIRDNHLDRQEKQEINKVINEYQDLFLKNNEPLSKTNTIEHNIILTNETPIYTKNYRLPQIYEQDIEEHVKTLLDNGIIQKSFSPWSSPIWIVPKKLDASGKQKTRMVIDFRKLNTVTKDDKFPIPNLDTLFDHIGPSKYFTTLDLQSGFHKIPMNKTDREKTAFSTNSGHFQFNRMPFGLKNAPATFQRMINNSLGGLINQICLVYMDDIIIFGKSLEEHINNIKQVFEKLRQTNLKIQLDKSEFLQTETKYLGYVINQQGLTTDKQKVENIKNLNLPKTKKEIKQFLGILGWYRRFIPNYANLTKPFTQCLRKNSQINIDDKNYKENFEKCKNVLAEHPILQNPDFNQEFILTTDASDFAIGAVLTQIKENKELPICYASKTLNNAEQNYSTIEKELKAIVWAVRNFRPYIYGRKFKIKTDHKPLIWLFNMKNPNQKLIRWKIELSEYNFDINYLKGKDNIVADFLSRQKPKYELQKITNDLLKYKVIAHCISADCEMSQGLAKDIDEKYQSKQYYCKRQNNTNLIIQKYNENLIFHLITKINHGDKPTLKDFDKPLKELRDYLIINEIDEIYIPKLGCGLDKQNWEKVKLKINKIFEDTNIKIHVCSLPKLYSNEIESNSNQNNIDENESIHTIDSFMKYKNQLTYK